MDRQTCPDCGNDIEVNQAQGLCPACLLADTLGPSRSEPTLASAAVDPIKGALEVKLRSQYRIIRLLGRGGMGAVYLARDLTLEREVAIKVIATESMTPDLYDRFRREAKTAAKLSHPNIVPLHAFGEVEGMPYFVMGYVRGESLGARLRRDRRIPEEETRRILGEIAHALDHAHRLGVIHRDVKPDNVLLDDETGRAVLTDFGVAKAEGFGESITRVAGIVGTPHYMSPEQASGHGAIDARTDIYALGVMGYLMLAGRLPHEGTTTGELLAKHRTEQPPSLRRAAPEASDVIVQAIERCLAKDPSARWQSARSLAQTLGAAEPSQLPDSLHAVEGRGLMSLILTAILFTFYWSHEGGREPALMLPVGWLLFYAFAIASLRREGFSLMQSQTVIWREPVWWPFWYPERFRRPGNVWSRLPASIRRFRVLNTVLFLILCVTPMVLVFGGGSLTNPRFVVGPFGTWTMALLAVMLVIWFVLRADAERHATRAGLDRADAFRILLSVAPSRVSFWGRPHISAILSPKPASQPSDSESPHAHLQAILRNGDDLSGPLRPLATEAADAARQLIAAIDQSDRRIAELMRNVEPGEEERLLDKIATLIGDDYAPLRVLLEKQLELVRDLASRLETERQRRNQRLEMLKMLSLHVASLRARGTETPSELLQLTDNVRALCDQIERQGAPTVAINDVATVERI